MDGPLFSPDSQNLAYRAWKGEKEVVVDGQEGEKYEGPLRTGVLDEGLFQSSNGPGNYAYEGVTPLSRPPLSFGRRSGGKP
jgi:hypothetical protein